MNFVDIKGAGSLQRMVATAIAILGIVMPVDRLAAELVEPTVALSRISIHAHDTPKIVHQKMIAGYERHFRDILERRLGRRLEADETDRFAHIVKVSIEQVLPPAQWETELASILGSHLSREDVNEAVRFYSTGAGQRILKAQFLSEASVEQAILKNFKKKQDALVAETAAKVIEVFDLDNQLRTIDSKLAGTSRPASELWEPAD